MSYEIYWSDGRRDFCIPSYEEAVDMVRNVHPEASNQ